MSTHDAGRAVSGAGELPGSRVGAELAQSAERSSRSRVRPDLKWGAGGWRKEEGKREGEEQLVSSGLGPSSI